MRLLALAALVMVAFAANSLLNRAAVGDGAIGPMTFAIVRLTTGSVALWVIVGLRRRAALPSKPEVAVGALALLAYMIGFSAAYLRLDAGLGALILFGGVQVTMFAGAVLGGDRPAPRRWIGAGIALAGLGWLFLPGAPASADPVFAASMGVAAIGWGVYSLNGRRAADPLTATATNFAVAAPLALPFFLFAPAEAPPMAEGLILAAVSGIVTSGLGYALWYAILPRLEASVAAIAQLTVPVIAIAGGALLLGEPVGIAVALGAALVLGGVALGVSRPRRD